MQSVSPHWAAVSVAAVLAELGPADARLGPLGARVLRSEHGAQDVVWGGDERRIWEGQQMPS